MSNHSCSSQRGKVVGIGADPSPMTTTALLQGLMEVAPLTAPKAPANIKAARAAIIVCFTVWL
jgi:hypothetical protein